MDDLEEVRQQFIADVGAYVEDVQMAADEARRFAESAQAAKDEADNLRDGLSEAAIAAGVYRDEMGRLRDAQGRFVSESQAAAMEMGHVRDEAAAAAVSVKELGNSARDTAAELDLMGLSGASTFTSIGGLVGVIGALVVAIAAVAPAVSAMGLGFGAFGLFAIPAIMQVSSGLQQVSQDMQAVQNAVTGKQLATATAKLNHDLAGMSPPIRQAVQQLLAFKQEFETLAQKSGIQSAVLGDLTKALAIARQVLPELIPLAQAGARAIGGLLSSIGQGLASSGFRQFLQVMTSLVVPATQAITRLAFTILGILGQALEQLAPMSIPVINVLNVLLQALGGPVIAALHVVISLFLGLAAALEPLLPGLSQIATILVSDIGSSFQAFVPILQQVVQLIGGALIQVLTDLLPVLANALTPNSPFFYALQLIPALLRAILPLITFLTGILRNPVFAQLAVDALSFVAAGRAVIGILGLLRPAFALLGVAIEATPVGWIITAIGALVFIFIELWNHSVAFREFWIRLWKEIQAAMAPVIAWAKQEIAIFTAWWNSHWTEIREVALIAWTLIAAYARIWLLIVTTEIKLALTLIGIIWRIAWTEFRDVVTWAFGVIRAAALAFTRVVLDIIAIFLDLVTGHWSKAWRDIQKLFHDYINGILSIAGAWGKGFVRFWEDLGHNVIQGFINGARAMIGAVRNLIGGIAHDISSAFTSILHLASPSRLFFGHAVDTFMGYINGARSMIPLLRQVMAEVGGHVATAGAIGLGVTGSGYGGTSAAGRVSVTVPLTAVFNGAASLLNDPHFLQYIQTVIQEAVLRYRVNNPGNGLSYATGGL